MGASASISDELAARRMRRESSPSPELWEILDEVMDPEIPVLSIWDLGILQDIKRQDDHVTVTISPTYSGCPAMDEIKNSICHLLSEKTQYQVDVEIQLSPAWTTEQMTLAGKQRLKAYGIAPPCRLMETKHTVACPRCGAENTSRISEFGSTACKALYQCNECLEPFDYFKCI